MCSILCTNKNIDDYDDVNQYLQYRGPDDTTILSDDVNNFTFVHNLLSMTGEVTSQPFITDSIVCLYNGEIYNYKDFGDYKSDGYCIIDLYKEHGKDFVKQLDGEYAILLLDFENDIIVMATDPFKTKPLFYSNNNNSFGCSTYKTPLEKIGHTEINKAKPNTVMVFRISDSKLVDEFNVVEFDLNQHKDNFDDWNEAFSKSIYKRTSDTTQKAFIGLSSGYDSGAICCELLNQNIEFKSYSVLTPVIVHENRDIIVQRQEIMDKYNFVDYTNFFKDEPTRLQHRDFLKRGTEEFYYTIRSATSNYNEYDRRIIDDKAASWMSLVCFNAKKDGYRLYLTGMGADELFSDYGFGGVKKTQHSNFGGFFPDDLSQIFPWPSFYYSSMESYIAKEEYVAGLHGIEARYPFLDKDVVQEFLWLSPKLKNSQYKSVIDQYFVKNQFPFSRGEKKGF
jgi:asparagine synthetase B (glutamine-hydrolysing)|tara:strand:+ start:5122 stop:6474 length:1353 start_codon:yes stop_codon:yes gene_type:complete